MIVGMKEKLIRLLKEWDEPLRPRELAMLYCGRYGERVDPATVRQRLYQSIQTGEISRRARGFYVHTGWTPPTDSKQDRVAAWVEQWFRQNPCMGSSISGLEYIYRETFNERANHEHVRAAVENLILRGVVVRYGDTGVLMLSGT